MKAAARWYDLFLDPPWRPSFSYGGKVNALEETAYYFAGLADRFTLAEAAAHMGVTSRETIHNRVRVMIAGGKLRKVREGRLMYFYFVKD